MIHRLWHVSFLAFFSLLLLQAQGAVLNEAPGVGQTAAAIASQTVTDTVPEAQTPPPAPEAQPVAAALRASEEPGPLAAPPLLSGRSTPAGRYGYGAIGAYQSKAGQPTATGQEPYHWKGLLLQSFAFLMLEHGPRVLTADAADRHLLLNKPLWSDYWASLGQFNMHRWNDGDSFAVNYIGHPMQGAISGYIEVQNDPRGRALEFSRDRHYWNSRYRAFLWSVAYSTQFEIGPISETSIFNQGGYTYPLGCDGKGAACEQHAKYTNNTGWVDFIITPVVGSLLLVGEDAIDRYLSDPLMHQHPRGFGYKVLRSSLNPSRSLANMLRGRYPWYRDYEHPLEYESPVVRRFSEALEAEPKESVDLNLFYSALSLRTNHAGCVGCRTTTDGGGAEVGFRVRRYVDVITVVRVQPNASPLSSLNIGGSLLTANFGIRGGYSGQHFALKASLAPGFASYSDTIPAVTANHPVPKDGRNFNFNAIAAVSGDIRFTAHLAVRATVEQMLIRYKSLDRDPPGIGAPPRLSFLSHDNYINSTNWGVRVGPVLRF